MNKLISVVVPVYNAEKYLEQCIDSVLEQTYNNIELILVDDGSTDSSGDICDKYALKDQRVKVVHQKNARIGAARNRGIEEATGDYLTFIDSDDYIERETYQECIKLIEKYNADLIQWDLTFWSEEGCIDVFPNRELSEYTELIMDRKAALEKMFEWKNMDSRFNHIWTDTHCIWTKMVKKELFDDLRFPEGKEYEDEMVLHHLIYKSKKVVFINRRFSNYRLRAKSTVHSMNLKGHADKVDALYDRYQMITTINDNEVLMRGIVHSCLFGIFNTALEAHTIGDRAISEKLTSYARTILKESRIYSDIKDRIMCAMLIVCPDVFDFVFDFYKKRNSNRKSNI